MSELTLFLIRFAYLAVLWIFVLSAVSVVRSDMFGARISEPQLDLLGRGASRAHPNLLLPAQRPPGDSQSVGEKPGVLAVERAVDDPSPCNRGRHQSAAKVSA